MTEDKMKKKPDTTLPRNPVAQAIREGYSNTKRMFSNFSVNAAAFLMGFGWGAFAGPIFIFIVILLNS